MDFISGFWKGDKSGANNKEPEQNSGVPVEEIAAKIENTNSTSQGLDSPAGPPSRLEETSSRSEIESSTNEEPSIEPITDEVSAGGKAAQLQDVSHKAYESAKYFGSFLYTVAGKAGQRVSETAKNLKHTVEENTLLGEFNKEQEAFLKSKGSASSGGVPPWSGCADEDSLKEQILSLSADKRNFVRTPPAGVSFPFDFEETYPTAMAVLREDKNLEKMRFELVPKMVTEENFWRNYFYRVSLVKQSSQLSSMSRERRGSSPDTDSRSSIEDSSDESVKARKAAGVEADSPIETPSHSEFVSDTYYADKGNVSADEVKRGMKQLGLQNRTAEEDWEEELQRELKEYEVVIATDDPEIDADWEERANVALESDRPSSDLSAEKQNANG